MRKAGYNVSALLRGLMFASAVLCLQSGASEPVGREDRLKAAFLINFAQFVQWPTPTGETFTLCLLGADGVRDALAEAAARNKKIVGGALAVHSLASGAAIDDCRLLFIESSRLDAGDRAREHADKPILTVSDAASFASTGGMIELFAENNRLRFRINVANAQRAGLHVSSDLLRLAASVEREESR